MPINPDYEDINAGPRFPGDRTLRERILSARQQAIDRYTRVSAATEVNLKRLDRDGSWGYFPAGSYDAARVRLEAPVQEAAERVNRLGKLAGNPRIR